MATYTYDTSTNIGRVRLNLGDTDVSAQGANAVFSDEEIQAFLDQEEGDSDRATGRALLTIANSQARKARAYRTGMLSREFDPRALRELAEKWLEGVAESAPGFYSFNVDWTDEAMRDRMLNDAQQNR